MAKVHIFNQYLWPDGAPTAIYAEMLADGLLERGTDVVLVGGGGSYRQSGRTRPKSPVVTLECHHGRRGSHLSTMREYASIHRATADYIREHVQTGDVAIVTSAPPSSITLHRKIRSRGAVGVYWLQDYYPELLRGVWEYPRLIRSALQKYWARHLRQWEHVVKAAGNLGYEGPNARVLRNWPTLSFPDPGQPEPNTALYSGNLGYGHDVTSFIAECENLHARGYRVKVRGDGPGVEKLPGWIDAAPHFKSEEEMKAALLQHEIHLIAAHPAIRKAIFPSKIWNSLAAGRSIVGAGFTGEMELELRETLTSPFKRHANAWVDFVHSLTESMPQQE